MMNYDLNYEVELDPNNGQGDDYPEHGDNITF
jgi:hypothetical protein